MLKLDIEAPPGEDISEILDARRKSWMKSRKFEEQLESDKIQVEVLKECIEEAHEDEHHKSNLQETLDRILQYTPLQVVLLVLAILDVAVVVSEILVSLHVHDLGKKDADRALEDLMLFLKQELHVEGSVYLSDMIQSLNETLHSCNNNNNNSSNNNSNKSSIDAGGSHLKEEHRYFYNPDMLERPKKLLRMRRSPLGLEVAPNGLPENETIEILHVVERALNITSIVILGIFLVVAVLKMVAGGKHFFTQIMEIIDAVVVTLSFILDIIKYSGSLNKDATEAAIVLLLLWQIVRMFNGIMLSELKRLDFRIKLLKRTRKRVESKASSLANRLKRIEKEVEGLKKLSRQRGALEEDILACRPPIVSGKPSALAGLSCIASMSVGLSISSPIALDLKEQRLFLMKSMTRASKGSLASLQSVEVGGRLSMAPLSPSDDVSSSRSNQVETEESTAEVENSSPNKDVFGGDASRNGGSHGDANRGGGGDDDDDVFGDLDLSDGSELKKVDEDNNVLKHGGRGHDGDDNDNDDDEEEEEEVTSSHV